MIPVRGLIGLGIGGVIGSGAFAYVADELLNLDTTGIAITGAVGILLGAIVGLNLSNILTES